MQNKKLVLCEDCDGKCCKYVALEIDVPETKKDFENIKWYVCHKNVNVFVDAEGDWYIEFLTPCDSLGSDGKCEIYNKRPKICKNHSQDECVFHNKGYKEKYTFNKIEDVENYMDKIFGTHQVGLKEGCTTARVARTSHEAPKDFQGKSLQRAKIKIKSGFTSKKKIVEVGD